MKTIDIKGKSYTMVHERILGFMEENPNGMITTEILSHADGKVLMMATVTPDYEKPLRFFTGHATEWQDDRFSMVNKTSYIENCETSAVGRALGMMGIGINNGFASADEVKVALKKEEQLKTQPARTQARQEFSQAAQKIQAGDIPATVPPPPELTREQDDVFAYLLLGKVVEHEDEILKVRKAKTVGNITRFLTILPLAEQVFKHKIDKGIYTAAIEAYGKKSILELTKSQAEGVKVALFGEDKAE